MSTPRAHLNCESLEFRDNPSGNVAAFLSAEGELVVIGDANNNRVNIEQNSFGDIVVTGLDGTAVNGQSSVYIGRGIPTGLQVDTAGGNDRIEVVGLHVSGNMMINGNGGDDSIVVVNTITDGFVNIDCRDGNDGPFMSNVIANWVVIDGGSGVDGAHADHVFTNQGLFLFNVDFVY